MAKNNQQPTIRSKYYWLLLTAAIIIGIVGIILILVWLSGVEGRVRIPRILLILPVAIPAILAGVIDEAILKKSPHLVRNKDRHMLASQLGVDPITGAPLNAGYGQPATYGIPDGAAYGSAAQTPAQFSPQPTAPYGYGQMPTTSGQPGQAPVQPTSQPGSSQSYGSYGYGANPTYPTSAS
ncbi:hypothetical protein [Actinomyces sp. MRS3W]|uniref:hypothetical protein n=1 Tax=Actinomyces sp. MRS3W TaxID=2800796 RepID=UPI0028FDAADD|nr:hypothetical protein [Actinomyces sp. MRS3W]MDU0349260.1 hypothetical protein [Actinomyces sp. MRS3W]